MVALREITEAAASTLDLERSSVWFYNEDRSAIKCHDLYERNLSRHSEGVELAATDYPAYFQALENTRAIAAHDAHTDPRTSEFSESYLSPLGITSMLDASIRFKGKTVGMICNEHVGPARQWGLEEESFAGALADMISQGMEASERKQAEEALRQREEQLRQAQKMEAIGQLAGGVAHDFNNLLTAIIGYSDYLQEELGEAHPLGKMVGEIKKSRWEAAALTAQLLAFSRKQVLQPELLDLNAVVGDMEEMVRRLIGEDIDLVTELSPELGKTKADPAQIKQIILNLASNARDAMPEGGNLTLSTENLELGEDDLSGRLGATVGRYVILTVSDTGSGMDEETLEHVFEPFFTTKKLGKGTGLGLASVYGIVKQSGGYIQVLSKLGSGTKFRFYFPQTSKPVGQRKPPAAIRESLRGSETILLVEDEIKVLRIVRLYLQREGYTVLEARNGAEALQVVKESKQPIHLLLSDVVMPVMSGPELAQLLTAQHKEIKLLYTSGYADHPLVQPRFPEQSMSFSRSPSIGKRYCGKCGMFWTHRKASGSNGNPSESSHADQRRPQLVRGAEAGGAGAVTRAATVRERAIGTATQIRAAPVPPVLSAVEGSEVEGTARERWLIQ